jgi:putative membrane protein
MTNATTNERSNATGVGNMTSPGAGTSTGTTNTGASNPGTSNTVPASGTPVGAAAEGVDLGAGGPATSGGTSISDGSTADAGADAGDAGQSSVDAEAVGDVNDADAGAPVADAGPVDAGASGAEALADGQIVTVVDVLNASEVEQAQAVLPRLQSDAVRAFAQVMIEEHQTARDGLATLASTQQIVAANSDVADQLRAQSQQAQSELGATDVAQLDVAYLDAQITAHGEAEALLAELSAAADSPELAAQLSQLRLNVAGHLQSASALRASLQEGTGL